MAEERLTDEEVILGAAYDTRNDLGLSEFEISVSSIGILVVIIGPSVLDAVKRLLVSGDVIQKGEVLVLTQEGIKRGKAASDKRVRIEKDDNRIATNN